MTEGSLLGRFTAHPLLVLGDDITTDHISPASAIPSEQRRGGLPGGHGAKTGLT
jgi:aconitase A